MQTIIYLTENLLDPAIMKRCQDNLLKEAGDIPIISVSQKPIDFGKNICVGEIGRSWLSLYKQLHAGLKAARTKDIVIAEHDVLYTKEHLNWKPPRDDIYYYNNNCWFVQWGGNHPELNGMYSYWKNRYALSQLVCNRKMFLKTITERLEILDGDLAKKVDHIYEPGRTKLQAIAKSGKPSYLHKLLSRCIELEKAELFKTKVANLDIKHGTNFTGPRRGKRRRYKLPHWGEFRT